MLVDCLILQDLLVPVLISGRVALSVQIATCTRRYTASANAPQTGQGAGIFEWIFQRLLFMSNASFDLSKLLSDKPFKNTLACDDGPDCPISRG